MRKYTTECTLARDMLVHTSISRECVMFSMLPRPEDNVLAVYIRQHYRVTCSGVRLGELKSNGRISMSTTTTPQLPVECPIWYTVLVVYTHGQPALPPYTVCRMLNIAIDRAMFPPVNCFRCVASHVSVSRTRHDTYYDTRHYDTVCCCTWTVLSIAESVLVLILLLVIHTRNRNNQTT